MQSSHAVRPSTKNRILIAHMDGKKMSAARLWRRFLTLAFFFPSLQFFPVSSGVQAGDATQKVRFAGYPGIVSRA